MAKWNAKSKELKEDIKSTKIKTTSKPTIIIKKPISEISVQPIETKQEEVHQITSSNTITPPNNNESILETKVEKEETKTIPVSFNFNATSQASAYSAHVPTSTPIQTVTEEESVCFLCKRKFPSNEALLKHKQLSELHKVCYSKFYLIQFINRLLAQFGISKSKRRIKTKRKEK